MNLLIYAAGIIFAEKRKGKGITSSDLARKMNTSEGSVRSFENGSKVISMDKFVYLTKLDDSFLYSKVVRLLTGLHIVFKSENKPSLYQNVSFINEIGDKELASVFDLVFKVYDETSQKNKFSKSDIKNSPSFKKLQKRMRRFLVVSDLFKEEGVYDIAYLQKTKEVIDEDIPSYDLDDVLNYIESRKRKPLLVKNDTVEVWEKENEKKIQEVVGITKNTQSIINLNYIKEFDYNYLFEPSFDSYRIIFLTDLDGNKLKQDFNSNFGKVYREKLKKDKKINDLEVETEIEKALSRVRFKSITQEALFENEILKAKLNNKIPSLFENFWSYRLDENRIVNFLSNEQQSDNNFLGVSEPSNIARKKMKLFNSIWKDI